MSLLFVDWFGRSLQVYHLEFDKESIYDDRQSEKAKFCGPVDIVLNMRLICNVDLLTRK